MNSIQQRKYAGTSSIFSVNFLQNNVTVGKAYTCADELTVNWGDAELYMWDMHLQPFAEDSGGKFGPVNGGEALTTPPPAGNWTVKDGSGNPCMLLSFAAQYVVNGQGFHNHVVNIVPSASINGTCASPTRLVDFFPDPTNNLWKLELGFTRNKTTNTYAMTKVAGSWPGSPMSKYPFTETVFSNNFLENNVTLGKAYTCADELTLDLGDAQVHIWEMHLQPFAGDSGGTFGPDQHCGKVPPPPPAGNWTVKDGSGNPCMLLSLAAQYVVNGQGFHNHVVNIEPSSLPNGTCILPTRLVDFFPDPTNHLWKLQLGFFWNSTDVTYTMTKVAASWPDSPGSQYPLTETVYSHNFLQNNVPLGKAYTCAAELTVDLGDAQVHLWDMHLQPFADYSGGTFGPEQRCGSGPTPMSASTKSAPMPTTSALTKSAPMPTTSAPTKSIPMPTTSAPTKSAPMPTTSAPTKSAPTKSPHTKNAPVVIIASSVVGVVLLVALVVSVACIVIHYRKRNAITFVQFA
ncbi:uncharacterized protein LOC119724003 [Patiria miniata]|uniref:Lysosome-associated membrane glycoprotein 5 n=1 Tax=Patiria miniata TaxID=46514 RepID=A0A913ZGE8_PATMI|nr:uncharacterized protein LOC119724003 [Patiria miniata]